MLAFVTVGTFSFDELVQSALSDDVLLALQAKGYTRLVVQCGNSQFEFAGSVAQGEELRMSRHGVAIELWKFRASLLADLRRADLVVGHAGAGTILDVLRLGKALIVVPNPSLLHNHQAELATALAAQRHLSTSSIPALAHTIAQFDPAAVVPFQPFDGTSFRALVDSEMGFA